MLMPFGESISVFSVENSAVATADAGEVSLESHFLKPLSSPLPKVADGFMKETETELPKVTEGFIEPIENPYMGDEYKFISEPEYEIPKVNDSGFIKDAKGFKSKPSKGKFIDEITPPDKNAKVINTPDDLASISKGGNYVLGCDIYLDEYNGGVWTPFEVRGDLTLDGQGHIIYNLNTDKYDAPGGLFSWFHGENLTVKNLGFSYNKDCYVEGGTLFSEYAGGNVEIQNCFSDMNVTGDNWYCGGLISQISSHEDVNISSSYNRGSISGSGYMGGLVGVIFSNASVNIYDCFNMGGIKGKTAGGLVGEIDWLTSGADLNVDIRRCENSAKITVENTNTDGSGGGICGNIGERFTSSSGIHYQFRHCKNTATISVKASDVISAGGIVGSCYLKGIEFYNCTNQGGITTSKVSGASSGSLEYTGGIIGNSIDYAYFDSCFNKGRIVAENFSGGLCAKIKGGDFKSSANSGVILSKSGNAGGLASCVSYFIDSVIACYNTGSVTGKIWAGGLIGQSCADVPVGYLYNPSLVMDSYNTGKISGGDAWGSSDGVQYLTSGIINSPKVIVSNCYNTGAITNGCGIASNAVDVKDCANYGDITAGAGIVFTCSANGDDTYDGRIIDCFNIGNITSGFGICESAGDITNCYNKGNIIYDDVVAYTIRPGAFAIAYQADNVKSCYNTGDMTGSPYAGGICHTASGNMTDCYNTGLISADYHACGLAVMVQKNVTNCYNTGKVEVTGLSFSLDGSFSTPMGALVGECTGKMKDSYNSGDFFIAGKSTYFGGLAGLCGSIENCYNEGFVQSVGILTGGIVYIGGISGGIHSESGTPGIRNSYNIGDVHVSDFDAQVSGICSGGSGYIENCINTGNVTGGAVVGISGTHPYGGDVYISNCVNTGTLTVVYGYTTSHGTKYYRGTSSGIGEATTISDCINTSDVADAGIGVAERSITNCVNLGSVTKNEESVERHSNDSMYTPGFGIGAAGSEISYCYNKGNVSGAAGYECYVDEYIAPCGIGPGKTVRNCINEGSVSSSDIGCGITLMAGAVYDCTNKGAVSGTKAAGIAFDANNIERCQNLASVTASLFGGGIAVDAEGLSDCKNTGNVSGKEAGGISVFSGYSVLNCINHGKVTAQNGGGGIVARCEMDSYEYDENISVGSITYPSLNQTAFVGCKNYGNVSGNMAMGIGDGVSHSGCENHGNITSDEESAGIGRGRMFGCINTGDVTVYSYSGNAIASGICSTSYWRPNVLISDCKNSGKISVNGPDFALAAGIFTEAYWDVNAYVTNSQNTGSVSAHSRHENADWPVGIYAGGVGGRVRDEYMLYIDEASGSTTSPSATVDTKFTGDEAHDRYIGEERVHSSKILAYGAIYEEAKEILPESVSISGPEIIEKDEEVLFSSEVLPEDADNKGLVWSSDNPTVASVSWDGTVKGISKGSATITAKTYNGKSASQTVTVQENAIYVTVMGFKREKPGEFFPLEGARVRAGGVLKTTGKDGKTWFERSDLPDAPLAPIHIDAGEDYVEKDDSINLVSNTLGKKSYTYYLAERDDQIYIKNAFVTIDGEKMDMLNNPGMVHIPLLKDGEINKTSYHVDVEIDWNRYKDNPEDQRVWIEGTESLNKYSIYERGDWISFATFFDAEEPLRLVATTKNKDGEEVRTEKILPLDVKLLDVSLAVDSTENLPIDNIYFLDKLGFKMSLGDVGRFAEDIKYENGVLTVVFKLNHSKNEKAAKLGILTGDVGPRVDITGTFKIPLILKDDARWSGSIGIKATGKGGKMGYDSYDDEEERTIKIFGHEHNFFIGNVPCYIDVEFGAGVEGSLGVGGTYDDVFFEGKIGGFLEGSIGGGVGGSINDNVKLKFGPEGSLEVKLPVVFSSEDGPESPVSFEPELEGRIDALLEVEFFDVLEIAPKVELGRYTWNRHDGGKWEHFLDRLDKKMTLQSVNEDFDLKNTSLNPKGREYLENGGGFEKGGFSLMSSGGEAFKKIFSNILGSADAETVLTNANKRIIFTTDNPERDSYNVMSLVYTDYEKGMWTEPKEIDNDETIDANASAHGNFVVWENLGSVMKSNMTIGDFLKDTDIKGAVFDGEKYVVTSLCDDDVYDFSPKVISKDGKAFAAWLSNSESDILSSEGITSLNYCFYDGQWTDVLKIEDIGQVTNINVLYNGQEGKIIYKKGTELYCVSTLDNTAKKVFDDVGRYGAAELGENLLCATFDSEGNLFVKDESGTLHTVETYYNKSENPYILSDGGIVRIFWTESDGIYYITNISGKWSNRLCYKKGVSFVGDISGVISENAPSLTFFARENSITDLIHMAGSGEDSLFLEEARADHSEEIGKVVARVYNNSEYPMENVTLKVTKGGADVEGEYETITIDPGCEAEISASLSAIDSFEATKLKVYAVCGEDITDGKDVIYTQGDISVSRAFFTKDEAGDEFLNIHVTNSGTTKIASTDVNVYENSQDSSPIYSFKIGALLPGETSEVRLEHTQNPDVVYYIRADADSDSDEYNNFDIIAYERVEEQIQKSENEISFDSQTKDLKIKVSKDGFLSDSGTVIAALYEKSGKLLEVRKDTFKSEDEYVEKTFTLTKAKEDCFIKIMYVSDLEKLKPLRKSMQMGV